MTLDPELFDDLFLGCAFSAYVESDAPPDSEATRRLAYRLYEDALAERSAARAALQSSA